MIVVVRIQHRAVWLYDMRYLSFAVEARFYTHEVLDDARVT